MTTTPGPGDPADRSPAAPQQEAPSSADEAGVANILAVADPGRVRRAPRFGRFALVGAVFGLVVCGVLTAVFAEPTQYLSLPGVFAMISVFTLPVFILLGCLVALILDRRSRRTRR